MLENYIYKRLSNLYNTDNIRFWRTTEKNEIDFVLTTSYRQGLAYEVKMKYRGGKTTSIKRFTKNYPNYPLETISYDTG